MELPLDIPVVEFFTVSTPLSAIATTTAQYMMPNTMSAVEGCLNPVATSMDGDPPRMTCDEPDHTTLEKRHKQ